MLNLKSLREKLQDLTFAAGQIKTAGESDSPESGVETAFSNLAHATVADKVSELSQYEIGFQIIDKSSDSTKMVGAFGYKIGSKMVIVPVFYINGELKAAHMYLPSSDQFIPLDAGYSGYLVGHKEQKIGDGVSRNLSLLGVMPPNLYQLSRPPNKFASATDLRKELLPALAYLATDNPVTNPKYAGMKTVPDLLKEAGEPLFRYLVEKIGAEYPKILKYVDELYGEEMLTDVAKHIAAAKQIKEAKSLLKDAQTYEFGETPPGVWDGKVHAINEGGEAWNHDYRKRWRHNDDKPKSHLGKMMEPKCAVSKNNEVKVITSDEVKGGPRPDLLHDLSTKDRERLIKEHVVVKDNREDKEVTIAFNVQTEMRLRNPDRTGLFEILVKPDKFERCLVIYGPYDQTGRNTFCTCISLETKRWINIHHSRLWAEAEVDDEAWREWFKKLPDKDSPGDGLNIALLPWGEGTVPFDVARNYGTDKDKTKIFDVWFRRHAEINQPFYQEDYPRDFKPFRQGPYRNQSIRLTQLPGKKIKTTEGDVCLPLGVKFISLKPAENPKKDSDKDRFEVHSSPPPLEPGNLVDMQRILSSVTQPLKIFCDGKDMTFDESNRLGKVAGLKQLIVGYGLREKAARAIIDEAERLGKSGKSYTVLLKKAEPGAPIGDMVAGAPNNVPFPEFNTSFDPMTGSNIPTQTYSEWNSKVPDMSAFRTDRSVYQPQGPDPNSIALATQAARTGQKEVFDTTMLGGLLKSVQQDSMVDKYLPDLMKGMDRLGRILFIFYWRGEEFKERYGKNDMVDLEDGLRNSFDGMGELILSLKRKSVDPYRDDGTDADLSSLASS
jgi:hypothetical protein